MTYWQLLDKNTIYIESTEACEEVTLPVETLRKMQALGLIESGPLADVINQYLSLQELFKGHTCCVPHIINQ